MTGPIVRHMPGLGFTIVAQPMQYKVNFSAYEIIAHAEDGQPCWRRLGANGFDPVEDLSGAEVYLHGEVKWDGCSNWHFDEQDRVMLHGCSRHDLVNIGGLLAACWDLTSELLPNFDGVGNI